VRPNSILQEHNIISRIYDQLDLEEFFPELKIINQDHAGFKNHIQEADLVVFTGKPSNGSVLLKEMKNNSILTINGAGHNPVIVSETADIDKAVEGTLMLKGFNGGQDCAGPDAILVHHKISQEFIDKFQKAFTGLKLGNFSASNTVIGPIHRFSELQRLADLIHKNSKDVIAGGTIDYKNSIVVPTIIVRGIERYPNYKEVYGPLTFIHTYKEDKDLAYYFEDLDGQYQMNRMYVSVYGESAYASARDDAINPGASRNIGIVLRNETIHEIEIGYKPYGGYSMGASGIIKKSSKGLQQVAMPILLPQVIRDYIIKNEELPHFQSKQCGASSSPLSIKTKKQIDPILIDFQKIVTEVFENLYCFAFVFGSAAKGKLKTFRDDLDTFICLQDFDQNKVKRYNELLADLHSRYNLKIDTNFPSEVMSLSTLEEAITFCDTLDVCIHEKISGKVFDNLFWIHALSDTKIGFQGNGRLLSSLIKKSQSNVLRWRNQIIEQIYKAEELPEHLKENFSGLNKQQVLEKLKGYSAHLIVHLGLSYLNEQPTSSVASASIFPASSVITFFKSSALPAAEEEVAGQLVQGM
jgi:predicted nucleotidyltransferase